MKVLEIKNNLVKIAYDVADNLALSGFVIIEDSNTPYVAQVVNIKADTKSNFAIVKLLFTFNEEGILKNYNGTIPSLKATVSVLPSKELLDIIPVEDPLLLGQLAQQDIPIKVDNSILENNLLICSNNVENSNILLNNIIKQTDKKTVIIDTDGLFDSAQKIVFGKDFKLPLNYDTINFIYDNDLEDVDATSKAIIQDIFIEVQEYTKTLPEKYLPFETFLNVVDQQYRETQITQLILLKNKLLKYKDLNVFAETLKDILSLSIAIEKGENVVIDISNIPPILQKEVISYICETMNSIKQTIYSFIKVDNDNTDKKLLKKLIERTNVYTTIICSHSFKYVQELKEIAQNFVLFAPLTLQHDFASYNTFLNKLNQDEFIIYGAHTQNIPLIVELDELNFDKEDDSDNTKNEENVSSTKEPNVIISSDESPITEEKKEEEETFSNETEQDAPFLENDNDNNTEIPNIEYPDVTIDEDVVESTEKPQPDTDDTELISVDDNVEIVNEPEISEKKIPEEPEISEIETPDKEPVINEDTKEEENIVVDDEPEIETKIDDITIEEEPQDDTTIYNILESEEDDNGNSDERITLEEPEIDYSIDDLDITADFQEPQIIEENTDALVEQAAKDVDKLMYEKIPEETIDVNNLDSIETDELTEDDLNLIGDLNTDNEITSNVDFSNPTPDTPVVPIYEADDIEASASQTFEPGDKVTTAKYGEGIVSKMTKYGNKMLCLIEFPKIGRRLLDPAVTEITKLS